MSFRNILPSHGEGNGSTSGPSASTSSSMNVGSDQRRSVSGHDNESFEASGSPSSKRRRVTEQVTRNACLSCKKARAKCDGKTPCKRCASRFESSGCRYEIHVKHAKEELVKQIKELKAKDHWAEQILQALSTGEKIPEILERLKSGETYESISAFLGRALNGDADFLSSRESQHSTFEACDEVRAMAPSTFWTVVKVDRAVLDHLFQLYFAWIHPVHTLFNESRFVDCYNRRCTDYCSSILVNAICALACLLHSVADGDETDFEQLGEEFSDATIFAIDSDDRCITTTQTFAVMFLLESARAHGLRASSYLKVATDNLPHVAYQANDCFGEVWRDTVRGIRNLNVEWAQMTFQVPPIVSCAPHVMPDKGENNQLDESKWYLYRTATEPCPAWPSLLATTNREKSKLTAIIHDVTTMMYSHGEANLTARHVLEFHSRFVKWRQDLPLSIGEVDGSKGQSLPHVLSLLIMYYNAQVQLLRPLLDLEGFSSPLVEETIWNLAQSGLRLLDGHYRTYYTCRYQSVLQMFSILHLTDVIVTFFPGGSEGSFDGPEAIQLGMEALQTGFPVSGVLQEMLRQRAHESAIRLPQSLKNLVPPPRTAKQTYRLEDYIDACTRPKFSQPVKQVQSRYTASFSSDWRVNGAALGFVEPASDIRRLRALSVEERGAQSLMNIRNLLNIN